MNIKDFKTLCHVCDLSKILVRISNRIVHISTYEDEGDGSGYDYTIYDANTGLALDGGVIINEDYSMADVLEDLYPATRAAQSFDIMPWELYERLIDGTYEVRWRKHSSLHYIRHGNKEELKMKKNTEPTYIFSDDGRYRFQVVDECPLGYNVWNVPADMIPGYLPFCRLSSHQQFPGGRQVDTETLKAVRCDHAEEIIDATTMGYYTPQDIETALKKVKSGKSELLDYTIKTLETALPYMKALPWAGKGR